MIRCPPPSVQSAATPLGTLRLRPQTAQDEPFLTALFESVKAAELGPLPEPLKAGLLRMQYQAMTTAYRSGFPDAAFDIILLGGTPVGRLVHDWTPLSLHVVYIAFLPEWQGRGLGTALMGAILDVAQARGVCCEATVAVGNRPSLLLWERLGFAQTFLDDANVAVRWRPRPGEYRP